MTDLTNFLAEQHAGEFDSTGTFTIAADKALAKLAHSQLPEPSYCILKVVQFATGVGATTVEVSIRRRTTRVAIPLQVPITVSDLRTGLDSVTPLADPALNNLVTGLRAIGGARERKFALHLSGPESIESLYFDGERLSAESKTAPSGVIALVLEVTMSISEVVGQTFNSLASRSRADEATALTTRAFTVPYCLTLDRRQLGFDSLASPRIFQQHLLWDFAPLPDGMRLPPFLKPTPGVRASAFWQISYHYQLFHKIFHLSAEPSVYSSPSTLFWLRDGVIVSQEKIVGPSGSFVLSLYVDANGCPVDLGGLNLRQSRELKEKRAMLRHLSKTIITSARERIASLDKLSGLALGGWDAFVTGASHLPLNHSMSYDRPGLIANKLNAHPGFRRKLLKEIKRMALGGQFLLDRLEF